MRELENAVKHALTFCRSPEIAVDDLPPRIKDFKVSKDAEGAVSAADGNSSLKSFLRRKEKEYIGQILDATGGDKEKAAETLKVNLSTLYRKLSDE